MQNSNNQGRKGRLGPQFQYEQSFMNKVVADYMAGDQSMSQVAARYKITKTQVAYWYSLFSSELRQTTLEKPIISTAMTEQEKKEFDALKKQNEELRKKLEHANLKAFAFQTMIEVAEEQFNIEIQKKPGTKPSAE
jgi:transposase-like protein